ncbi:spore coat U domain-containing protein [Aquabacterium sp.]|uniref:Csu type fimbrial protein n=1 Tax=Aquabacterium sp. TaxID=1872578 RepID=UPI0019A07A06|nr:spore coat U domain-containing protein [Aquabacterium sp.]MBC7700631.1 spore coat protein U domain-containing protein [Aquabacterium sp.]
MKCIVSKRLLVAASLWALTGGAQAATATASMGAQTTVSNSCVNVGASAVSFGTYNPNGGSVSNATGSVSITCVSGTTYTISLDAGLNAGSATAYANRRMRIGATSYYLAYQLYIDSGRTQIWGDGANASSVKNPSSGVFTATGSAINYTAYGQIAASVSAASGSYTDTVTVTFTWS